MIRLQTASLKEGRWYEWILRFVLGGAATVATGVISGRFGPAVGGLFLALPAVFCASATMNESHEKRRKREKGLAGARRGREAAALDAAGAILGSFGLLAFAGTMAALLERSVTLAFCGALAAWTVVAFGTWKVWQACRHL